MASEQTLQGQIDAGVALLPPAGESIEFNEFKAKLYAANPDGGKDVLAYMLKNGLVKASVKRQPDKSMKTSLSRRA